MCVIFDGVGSAKFIEELSVATAENSCNSPYFSNKKVKCLSCSLLIRLGFLCC